MNHLSLKCWGITTKRIFGLGCSINVVAVHSRQINPSAEFIKQWYEEAIIWIKTFNVEPLSFSSYGVSGFQEAKTYGFIRADKKLRKRGFANVESLYLSASPVVSNLFSLKSHIEVSFERASVEGGISCFVWTWSESIKPLTLSDFKALCKQSKQQGILDYAFATQMNSKAQPHIYASHSAFVSLNVKGGTISCKIKIPIAKIKEFGCHQIDFLRDIFPYQILSSTCLTCRMGSQTLREWIDGSESHGVLNKYSHDRWMWEIPVDRLNTVRSKLVENNLLVDYLSDVSRIFETYRKQPCRYSVKTQA